jgi:hypothetical protein
MKKIISLLGLSLLSTGCQSISEESSINNEVPTITENYKKLKTEKNLTLKTSQGNQVVLYDFEESQFITSPLKLKGSIPVGWAFEASFPITLKTDRGEIIKEWYGTAEWIGDDGMPILKKPWEFTAEIEFKTPSPQEAEFGILTLGRDIVSEETKEDFVNIKVLFE